MANPASSNKLRRVSVAWLFSTATLASCSCAMRRFSSEALHSGRILPSGGRAQYFARTSLHCRKIRRLKNGLISL
jgi:hypothetical protein